MMNQLQQFLLCVAAVAVVTVCGSENETFPETVYNYVEINQSHGAHMFYGLRGDHNATFRADPTTPLVMWLQGGPGCTSQFGNFLENGPEKLEMDPTVVGGFRVVERIHRWTKHANMLYVDNPVGSGFSYVTSPEGYAISDEQIGEELVSFMRGFLQQRPEFKWRDFWIFCESYGGKMTAYFGAALAKAQANPETALPVVFKGVSIGDGWVDPVSCMRSYGPYLQTVSGITEGQVEKVNRYANLAADSLEEGHGVNATNYWGIQQYLIDDYTANMNWYNWEYYTDYTADVVLGDYLRGPFTQKYATSLNASYPYNDQSNEVFNRMQNSFMVDGVSQIDYLIEKGYSVNIESGQMDLIVDARCIQRWISKLQWHGLKEWLKAKDREPLFPANLTNSWTDVGGYRQQYKNFALYQILKAGHMIPLDNPAMAETMFVFIIGGNMTKVDPNNPNPPTQAPFSYQQQQGAQHQKPQGHPLHMRRMKDFVKP